jgi:hypothetical protein
MLFPDEFKSHTKIEKEKKIFAFYKLDGDIIKLYYYNNNWELGSNKIPG